MKLTCKNCIGFASKILLIASLFIFTSVVFAQTDVYVGDEDVVIEQDSTNTETQQLEQLDTEVPASSNVQEVPAVRQPEPVQAQKIETAPQTAPDSGPEEALIISVSILIGLAFATYFLFKNIKKYNS